MNLSSLKAYAQQARREFIAAVTARAAEYGLTEKNPAPLEERGDVVLIGKRAFPGSIAKPRARLADRIRQEGFGHVMEAMAYTWFNRLVAIRYMELHGFLNHGMRVLSHPSGEDEPEILQRAHETAFPELDREYVIELKLDGTRDEELYRRLLLGQCHALHRSMPLLFDPIGHETELLIPRNLLRKGSVVYRLIHDVEEDAWEAIEIVGWLYQFYISERKDEVIGKVVAAENIPAATQLFTPNWIVKYLVQNSLGAMWLATYPESSIARQMEYYISPGDQAKGVRAVLASITPSALNPEEITFIDPAVGSGHILVEAYDLFRAIYLERGYTRREIPRLILTKNLFGLDIDPRAAQLSSFAVLMKGLADDPRLLESDVALNILAIRNSTDLDVETLDQHGRLSTYGLAADDLRTLKELYLHGSTFGSLIQVPETLASSLPALAQLSKARSPDLFVRDALRRLRPLVEQSELLEKTYDVVAANPPYMGSKAMTAVLKKYVKVQFPFAARDLFACFIERAFALLKTGGYHAMVTMQSWMFLSSFEKMRTNLLRGKILRSMAHLGARAFGTISGEVVQLTAFAFQAATTGDYRPTFIRLVEGSESDKMAAFYHNECRFNVAAQDDFHKIPRSPIVYWVSDNFRDLFARGTPLGELIESRVGLQTSNNDRFLRRWWEVDIGTCGFGMKDRDEALRFGKKWFPHNKGGPFRKWYGNHEYLVNWKDDGREIRAFGTEHGGRPRSVVRNPDYYFREAVTWSDVTSGPTAFRMIDEGTIHDTTGHSAFGFTQISRTLLSAYCNTPIVRAIAQAMNPTMHFHVGDFAKIPFLQDISSTSEKIASQHAGSLLQISRTDWNAWERSWEFNRLPFLSTRSSPATTTIESSYESWLAENHQAIATTQRLEEENNRLFIDAYGLSDELSPSVPIQEVTLTVNPAYRYGSKLPDSELQARFLRDSMAGLISYAIGCMMGRYSLDVLGLVYANSSGQGFDPDQYPSYPADDDGIVPITGDEWFEDDAARRLEKFATTAWDSARLEDNLAFIAAGLRGRLHESSRDTVRRYFVAGFYKDHLQAYQKRPIYWLFTSGRRKAFQCLVYLHRYHEGTLARMRTEYVIPLQGMMVSRLQQLEKDIETTNRTRRRRLEKEQESLSKDQNELRRFDEKLRHYADRQIQLDLDDGVKANYGKFGDLLAKVREVTGVKPTT